MRGKLGGVVLVATPEGCIARTHVRGRQPRTPAKIAAQVRHRTTAQAWSDLDDASDARWRSFAENLGVRNLNTGVVVAPRPDNVFGAHYSRMLLVDPSAEPPQFPPATTFFGDAISVALSTAPSLPFDGESGAGSDLVFTASGANAPGVVTQILTQSLVSRKRRTYLEKYRHAGLVRYEAGDLTATLPCAGGWVACAYRFIREETGQATALAEIGKVRVG